MSHNNFKNDSAQKFSLPPELARKIRRFEINSRKLIVNGLAGAYRSVFRGRGMEFDEVRPYLPGDEIRLIDWNVSARTGELYIKKHVEEREQTVVLVVDMSASGDFTSTRRTKREIAAEICCILGFTAAVNNDRVGLLMFTDQIEHYVAPRRGSRHALRIVRDLLLWQPQSRCTDITMALNYLHKVLRRSAVIFLVSDFLTTGFDRALKLASYRHDLVAIEVQDPHEITLPSVGLIALTDAETGAQQLVDTSSPKFRAHWIKQQQQAQTDLHRLFKQLAVDYIQVDTKAPYETALHRLFLERARQRR
jgi:uncharacterized protein (DUF58 family)